jgi:hypothetical protein
MELLDVDEKTVQIPSKNPGISWINKEKGETSQGKKCSAILIDKALG